MSAMKHGLATNRRTGYVSKFYPIRLSVTIVHPLLTYLATCHEGNYMLACDCDLQSAIFAITLLQDGQLLV